MTQSSHRERTMNADDLCEAIYRGYLERVRKLAQAGADLDAQGTNGWTPLMVAAEVESIEIALFLLESGANVNCAGLGGQTPLHVAVDASIDRTLQTGGSSGEEPLEMIRALINGGARMDIKDANGRSALNWAEDYKSKKVIQALIRSSS